MRSLLFLALVSAMSASVSFASAKGLSIHSVSTPAAPQSDGAPLQGRAPLRAAPGPVYGGGEIHRVRSVVRPPRGWARPHVWRGLDWSRGQARSRHAASQSWRVIHVGAQDHWRTGPAIYGVGRTLAVPGGSDDRPVVRSPSGAGPRIILGGAGKTWRDAVPVIYGF